MANRKYGRNKEQSKRYAAENRLAKNKAKRIAKQKAFIARKQAKPRVYTLATKPKTKNVISIRTQTSIVNGRFIKTLWNNQTKEFLFGYEYAVATRYSRGLSGHDKQDNCAILGDNKHDVVNGVSLRAIAPEYAAKHINK